MKTTKVKLSDLALNEGQIAGLPQNPRSWTQEDIERLAQSIRETPELLEARPILAYQVGAQYVIIGGNMRYSALKHLGETSAPCIVLPAEMSVDKLKELVIKDNGAFGAWDWDNLANEWDDLPLGEWGVPAWSAPTGEVTDYGEKNQEIDADDLDEDMEMKFKLKPEEFGFVRDALARIDANKENALLKLLNYDSAE